MLSEKLISFCKDKGCWYDDVEPKYRDALLKLGIDTSSDFADFYLHVEDGPTFLSRKREIYQICWFFINSNYIDSLQRTREALKISEPYIPMDGFEGDFGFFYNKTTGEVVGLGLGGDLKKFSDGNMRPQWGDFNSFIEWFFELSIENDSRFA